MNRIPAVLKGLVMASLSPLDVFHIVGDAHKEMVPMLPEQFLRHQTCSVAIVVPAKLQLPA